ncbi:MAG: cyclic 2,3-diphosphoglycerate synthase [Anaerolineae bacterium]|nr:cyclic 2,3-diphosphoglycerate synthase [Anaerolineae bacterium]
MSARVIIMGAAGRDFHNFNVRFRNDSTFEVVAFTAAQIPNIAGRIYPPELAGSLYPNGIPIYPEEQLLDLIRREHVNLVVFAYSDVPHDYVMHRASAVLASGADFWLMGADSTMLEARVPVVAVGAVRTGAGKSQTTRHITSILTRAGRRVVVVRHPMPYGDLSAQVCQRFETLQDLEARTYTIEEREEFEPLVERGVVVYAGVDYERILREAEAEADVILWDGGNNDLPFYRPDLHIVVADPHRPGHELAYYPGEANLRMADAIVINKVDTAPPENVRLVRENVQRANPNAVIVEAASPIFVEDPAAIRGRRVLVIEDGPTLTHGGMAYGAGVLAAQRFGAAELVDPRPYALGSIRQAFEEYPSIGPLLPAMGYGPSQLRELEQTINATPCDLVLIATPVDLRRMIALSKPAERVRYELQEIGRPTLEDVLERFLVQETQAQRPPKS